MDIIDKIFNKLEKEQAPHSLRARILEIPDTQAQKSGRSGFSTLFKAAVPAFLIVLLVGGLFYVQYWRVPQARASFGLVAEQITENGIEATSSFVLTSSAKLSSFQIKQIVKFNPEVDFDVENLGDKRYRLTPKGDLSKDEIYQVTIAEGPADHDYSWAYQVKADFQIISTLPGSRGTDVPVNTGIEINFNRERLQTPEKYFEISPSVNGAFEQHGTMLLFRPAKPLEMKTVYTITVKKGLATQKGDEALSADYVFSFETQSAGGFGGLGFYSDFVDVIQSKPILGVYAADGVQAKGHLYKFDRPEGFIASYADSDNWQYNWTYYNNEIVPKDLDKNSAKKILEYDMVFGRNGYNSYTEIPQDLDDGYYLLDAVEGGFHSYVWFQKTPLAHYSSYSYERSLVWLYDFSKKQPIKEGGLYLLAGQSIGQTDSEGLAQFDTPGEFKENNRELDHGYYSAKPNVTVAKIGGYNPYYITQVSSYWNRVNEGSKYWSHLSTDRPLYHLSDSIQFWGIVRPRDNIKAPDKVQISLYRGYAYSMFGSALSLDEPITSVDVPVSRYSTYEGKIDFSGLTADTYTLLTKVDGKVISSKSVAVTTFSKPAYQISISALKDAYYTGEKITFDVSAKFYDGTPVPKLDLSYNSTTGASGIVTTDRNGQAKVEVVAPYDNDTMDQPRQWPNSLFVSVASSRSEEGYINATDNVIIVGPKVYLSADTEIDSQGTNTFTVKARQVSTDLLDGITEYYGGQAYDDLPVLPNQKIQAKIKKTTFTQRQTGEYYDFIAKVNRPTYTYDKSETIVEDFSGTTDKTGVWKFDRKFAYEPNVHYSLYFESADDNGKIARANSYYWFSNNPYFYGSDVNGSSKLHPTLNFSNLSRNYEANVGDDLNFNLSFNNPERAKDSQPSKVLYYAYQRSILKATTSSSLIYKDTFAQGMSPMVAYKAVVLGPTGFEETGEVPIFLNTKTVEYNIDVKTDKEQYRPGETVNAVVKVTDSKGKTGSGTVHVSVVDEAVFDANGYDETVDTLGNLYAYILQSPAVSLTQYNEAANDGGGGGGGPELPRSNFLDTVLYQSYDLSSGEAKVSFKLPDNLTSWRITAQAFNPDSINAGSAVKNIATGLPLFADMTMSPVYVKGDEPQIRVRVFGTKYDSGSAAKIKVVSPELGLNFDKEVKGNTVYIPLKSLPVGQFKIETKVSQGELSDSLVRTVQVLESGLSVPKTARYKVSEGLQNISGDENGLTEIVVTDAGKGRQFGTVSMLAYQGGTRLDQRASAYYAQTVLRDVFGMPGDVEPFEPSIYQTQMTEGSGPIAPKSGLSLFSYGDPELKPSVLTAVLIPESVPKDNLVAYFQQSIRDDKADVHRISQSLLGLAAFKQPVLTKIQMFKDEPSLDIEDQLYVANAMALLGDKENARTTYFADIKPKLVSDSNQLYIADPDQTRQAKITALAGMLSAQLNIVSDRDQIASYLENNPPQKDLVSLEQAFMVKSALGYSSRSEASFDYKTEQRHGSFKVENGNRFNMQLLASELKTLQFSNVKGDLELLSWYLGPADSDIKPNLDVQIKRSYSVDGKVTNSFNDGQLVKVTITVGVNSKVSSSDIFQLTDIMPSGLRPVSPTYYSGIQNMYNLCTPTVNYPDVIDGNKISFTINRHNRIPNCGTVPDMRVEYYARVISTGTFRADQTMVRLLDNPSQFGLGATQQVKISE